MHVVQALEEVKRLVPVPEIWVEQIYFALSHLRYLNGLNLAPALHLVDLELEKGQELVRKACLTKILFLTNVQQKIICSMKRK